MTQTIAVIAQHFEGQVDQVTYELVACALELQRIHPGAVKVIILGDDVEGLSQEISKITGLDVIGMQHPNLIPYNAEAYKAILENLLLDLRSHYICIAHTNQGCDYAPALAVRLRAACITGVERVIEDHGRICFERAIYNRKILANVIPKAKATVLTVQPGAFKAPDFDNQVHGSVDIRTITFKPQQSRTLEIKRTKEPDSALAEAEVIVSAGKGIGKKENLDFIFRLAKLFPKSAVGGSRPVCDMGWLEYRQQVGITGATVEPKLYIACGISGSTQHLAGMRNAGLIVALNTDPNAAIFNVANVCIVEDLTTFIPVLIKEHEKEK